MRGHAEAEAEAAPTKMPPGDRAPRMTLAPWRQRARRGLAAAFVRRDARTLAWRAVLALLALAALLRLALILRGWPSLDSDEAVVGLMARHILHNGEYPDFFWGQFYLGPLQAYAAAALFAVFGASLVALRLPALLFTLCALAGTYALGRAAYGRAVGLLALAWLALGPPYALIRQIVADGGHQEMLLLAALVLLGVWDRLRRPESVAHHSHPSSHTESSENPPRPPSSPLRVLRARFASFAFPAPLPSVGTPLEYFGIGAAMGLGFWSDPLMLPVLIAALGALVLGRRRELFSAAGIALLLGFCVGAFPFLLFNVTSGGASFAQIAHQRQLPGGQGTSFSLAALLGQLGETLAVALPATFGSPHVCVTQGNIWGWYPPRLGAIVVGTGLCQDANILFSLGILALYAAAALPIIRRWRGASNAKGVKMRKEGERLATEGTEEAERSENEGRTAALWLRGMLLFIALFTIAAYASGTDAQLNQFTAARYFISLWLTTPLLFGVLWGWAAPAVRAASVWAGRIGAPVPRRGGRTPYAPTVPSIAPASSAPSASSAFSAPSAVSSAASLSDPSTASVSSVVNLSLSSRASRVLRLLRGPRLRSVAAALVLLAVFAVAIVEAGSTLAYAGDAARFGLPMTRTDQQIIAFLDAHHITRYYSDYWTCYRIAFESDERIVCAVRGQNGEPQLRLMNNRYPGYERLLAATPYPAYILPAGSPADAGFAAEAAAQGLHHAGYVRAVVAGYAVYYHPG